VAKTTLRRMARTTLKNKSILTTKGVV